MLLLRILFHVFISCFCFSSSCVPHRAQAVSVGSSENQVTLIKIQVVSNFFTACSDSDNTTVDYVPN